MQPERKSERERENEFQNRILNKHEFQMNGKKKKIQMQRDRGKTTKSNG